jgi:hypothetical protein
VADTHPVGVQRQLTVAVDRNHLAARMGSPCIGYTTFEGILVVTRVRSVRGAAEPETTESIRRHPCPPTLQHRVHGETHDVCGAGQERLCAGDQRSAW